MKTITITAVIAIMTLTVSCTKSNPTQHEVALSEGKPKPAVSATHQMDALDAY